MDGFVTGGRSGLLEFSSMASVHIRPPFACSRRAPVRGRPAWAAEDAPYAKRELLKLCARVGYTPH